LLQKGKALRHGKDQEVVDLINAQIEEFLKLNHTELTTPVRAFITFEEG
jgi:hypothetical protein